MGSFLRLLAMATMFESLALTNNTSHFDGQVTVSHGSRPHKKTPLTPRQVKARKRSKISRKSRKANRH
jgi:hypothetical protein